MVTVQGHQGQRRKTSGGFRSFGSIEQLLTGSSPPPPTTTAINSSEETTSYTSSPPDNQPSSRPVPDAHGVFSGPDAKAMFRRRYRLLETLGVGTFSTVRAALDVTTGVRWACKVVPGDGSTLQDRLREVHIHRQLSHSNIVAFREAYLFDGMLFIVTELLSGVDLLDCMLTRQSTFSECELREVACQLLEAAAYMADAGVAHRDFKPENFVLVDNGAVGAQDDDYSLFRHHQRHEQGQLQIKLIDFGLAGQLTAEEPHFSASCGSLAFVAPELLAKPTTQIQYGTGCDVWSIGISLFTLAVGRVPYDCTSPSSCIRSIRAGPPSLDDPTWSLMSEEAVDFMQALLTVDPQARPSARVVLSHPWLLRRLNYDDNDEVAYTGLVDHTTAGVHIPPAPSPSSLAVAE